MQIVVAGARVASGEVCLADDGPRQPLDVLMRTMRALFREGRLKEAADIAKAAAPYVHPRAMARGRAGDISTLRDHELDGYDEADCGGARASGDDTD